MWLLYRPLLTNPTVFKIRESPFLISTSSPSDADHLVHIIHTLEKIFLKLKCTLKIRYCFNMLMYSNYKRKFLKQGRRNYLFYFVCVPWHLFFFFFLRFYLFIYFVCGESSLLFTGFSLVAVSRSYLQIAVACFSLWLASLVMEHGLR